MPDDTHRAPPRVDATALTRRRFLGVSVGAVGAVGAGFGTIWTSCLGAETDPAPASPPLGAAGRADAAPARPQLSRATHTNRIHALAAGADTFDENAPGYLSLCGDELRPTHHLVYWTLDAMGKRAGTKTAALSKVLDSGFELILTINKTERGGGTIDTSIARGGFRQEIDTIFGWVAAERQRRNRPVVTHVRPFQEHGHGASSDFLAGGSAWQETWGILRQAAEAHGLTDLSWIRHVNVTDSRTLEKFRLPADAYDSLGFTVGDTPAFRRTLETVDDKPVFLAEVSPQGGQFKQDGIQNPKALQWMQVFAARLLANPPVVGFAYRNQQARSASGGSGKASPGSRIQDAPPEIRQAYLAAVREYLSAA